MEPDLDFLNPMKYIAMPQMRSNAESLVSRRTQRGGPQPKRRREFTAKNAKYAKKK
jgi:hypothetical protein